MYGITMESYVAVLSESKCEYTLSSGSPTSWNISQRNYHVGWQKSMYKVMYYSIVCSSKEMAAYMLPTILTLGSKELDFQRVTWINLKKRVEFFKKLDL